MRKWPYLCNKATNHNSKAHFLLFNFRFYMPEPLKCQKIEILRPKMAVFQLFTKDRPWHLAINSTTALAGEADMSSAKCSNLYPGTVKVMRVWFERQVDISNINSFIYRGLDLCGWSNSVQLFCTSNTRGQCRRQHDVPIQPQCQKISAYYNKHRLNIKRPKFKVKL